LSIEGELKKKQTGGERKGKKGGKWKKIGRERRAKPLNLRVKN